jgi:hypothetical protein
MAPTLDSSFATMVLDPTVGQWWRIHGADHGAWFFASSDATGRAPASVGRLDLSLPNGTCYLGEYLAGAASESLRETGVSHSESQVAANTRRLSQMPLDRWYGKPIADFTSAVLEDHGAPTDIAALPRADARRWAEAARAAGFDGILYRLGQDPQRRRGLALFGGAGEHAPADQPPAQPLPVGLRKELTDLFNGEYRGDPLLV